MKTILLATAVAIAFCSSAEAGVANRDVYLADWAFSTKHVVVPQSAAVDVCKSWQKFGGWVSMLHMTTSSAYAPNHALYAAVGIAGRDAEVSLTCRSVLTSASDKPVTF